MYRGKEYTRGLIETTAMTSSESVSMIMNSILMLLRVITCSFHDVSVTVREMLGYCSAEFHVLVVVNHM